MDLVAFAKDNWTVIAPAIWQFIILAVLAFGAGWAVARQRYDDRLATAADRITHRDEEIERLKKQIAAIPSTPTPLAGPDKKAIRLGLATLIDEGHKIRPVLFRGEDVMPLMAAWQLHVTNYLSASLDQSYVTRFLSLSGTHGIHVGGSSLNEDQKTKLVVLDNRLEILSSFVSEMT